MRLVMTQLRCLHAVIALALLAGCATSKHRAPVEDRASALSRTPVVTTATPTTPATAATTPPIGTEAPKPLPPGSENAGKPGYYTVKPGDTLIRVGLETGQNWKDILKWNNLDNPNVIESGQVLRVVPPGADPNTVMTRGVTASASKLETKPLDNTGGRTAPPSPAAGVQPPAPPAPSVPPQASDDENMNWMWPANGAVIAAFDEAKSKGIAITGKAGDPVLAAADGRVVYAGSGLRGYGNLVIVKHNGVYLTAYAHNQNLLVKEEQSVRRGQKIAEMGSTDAERVNLHFEIRKQGKPVDPAKLLPPR